MKYSTKCYHNIAFNILTNHAHVKNRSCNHIKDYVKFTSFIIIFL